MHSIQLIDYAIIVGYLVLVLAVGLYMTRKASSSLDEYFLAGRSMPWYMLGIAGMTNWFDMTGTMIITSFLYMLGPRGLFIEFRGGVAIPLAFMLCYLGKWHRRSGCLTAAEWMTYRFGDKKDAHMVRIISAVVYIVVSVGMIAYLIRGTTLFVGMFLPYSPVLCTLALILITTIYTTCSGFYGVVLADLVQGAIIILCCLVMGLLAWAKVPDSASLAMVAQQVTGNSQWTNSMPAWHTSMPAGYEAYQSLIMFSLFYLVRNIIGGMGAGAEARYFGARNDRECGLQSLLQALTIMLRWPMMIGFAVMGIYMVHSMYPDSGAVKQASDLIHQHLPAVQANNWHDVTNRIAGNPGLYPTDLVNGLRGIFGDDWATNIRLVGCNGTINPECVLPAVLKNVIPSGLKGVLLVGLLAAMMSTFTATVNGASAFFVKDIYQTLIRAGASNRELIVVSYVTTVVVVCVGFLMGIAASSINDLWGWIMMGLTSGLIAPLSLRLYWWRCNAWGMTAGMALGGIGAVLQRTFLPGLHEWYQFLLMSGLSFFGTIVFSIATSPTPMERLRHFYRTTRPFGWWGPVRATFDRDEQNELAKEHRNDIIALPFALVWQVTLFMLPMQLVIKSYDSFLKTLPIFLVSVIGMYYFWWRNLPPAPKKGIQDDSIIAENV